MGSNISLTIFEYINEIYIAVSSGILGILILINHGLSTNRSFRTIVVGAVTIQSLLYAFRSPDLAQVSETKVIFITGCDSGLGFSIAQHTCELGFTVLAGFLNLESDGARDLRRTFGDKIHQVELDITDSLSVAAAVEVVTRFLVCSCNTNYTLWAVINNAAVMVFGEFEWLTESLIKKQLDVNLFGTFRVTKSFCPLLRKYKGRIITVTSHCAQNTLPGLAVYGSTKAALKAWSDGLRIELEKYGIKVITFIPGSFVQQSNIMARQIENVYEMHSAMSKEQRKFYGDYFKRYNSYLSALAGSKVPKKIEDPGMYKEFEKSLLHLYPKAHYVHEPIRYTLYHTIFKYSPTTIRDYFVARFMQMPKYEPKCSVSLPGVIIA